MKKLLIPLLFGCALVGIWQLLVMIRLVPEFILPSPVSVAQYLGSVIADGSLAAAVFITLKRLFIGYLVAIILGIPLGVLSAKSTILSQTLGVMAVGIQTLPSVCWVPFALLVFGQSESAMLFVVVMGSVGSILLAAESSIRHIPKSFVEAAATMGSRGLHTIFFVLFPASLPELFSGMKQGWAFAWRSLMAAEIYVSVLSGVGVGQMLHYGRELHAMDQVIGIMVIVLAIGLILDKMLFAPIQAKLSWQRGL